MSNKGDARDARIAAVAAKQHGVVTARQLGEAGLSRAAITKRVQTGRLHRVHRGVYAVGHRALGREGRWMGAVLACGRGAVLSHGSAAALWDLLRPPSGAIEVSIPTRRDRARRRGILVRPSPSLVADPAVARMFTYVEQSGQSTLLVTRRKGIPVTNVQRTIDDLRQTHEPWLVRRAIRQAELAGHRLDRVVSDRSRSDLERDFLAFCRRHAIPRPEVNAKVGKHRVDFLWREQRVAVETDDFTYHRGSVAFEDDHARDLELRRRGYDVRRYTGTQLDDEPDLVAADLSEALRGAARA